MAINLSGMFANLGAATSALGEQVKGPMPTDRMDRNVSQMMGITNPMLQMTMGGLGVDMRTLGQIKEDKQKAASQEVAGALNGTYEEMLVAAKKLISMGMVKEGTQLFQLAEEKKAKNAANLQAQQLRETVAAKALELGLSSTAEMAANGGDLKEAQKQIQEEEKRIALNTGGKPARIRMAINAGLPELAKAVRNNEYNTVSDEEFQSLLDGSKADLKVYDDGSGPRPFKVNEYGKVYDPASNQWVNPSELGLQAAPQLTKDVSDTQAFNSKLSEAQVTDVTEGLAEALDARELLENGSTLEQLLDNGILSGAFATVQKDLWGAAERLGVLPQEEITRLENTEVYLAAVGKAVATEIRAFGTGPGLSDNDREFANNMAGGKIEVTEKALKRILAIRKKAAYGKISRYLDTVDRLHGSNVMNKQHYEYYRGPFNAMDLSDSYNDSGSSLDTSQPQATQIGRFKVTVGS